MSFWNILWFIFISFAFLAYLIILFRIVTDLFRDHDTSGWVKALWIVFLIIFPLLTALVYLIARGRGMTERDVKMQYEVQQQQAQYIKSVAGGAGTAPSEQITQARALLDSGTITQAEFDALKAKALA